jgi:hypothetical protein
MGKVAAQGVDGQLGLRQSQGLRHAIRFCECGREPVLVVGEQPAPGAAVALHHLQHRLAFIAHQAPGAEGAGHQGESILQIAEAPFLEAALVERVALDQMLAQHLGGPGPELGSAGRFDAVANGDDYIEVVDINLALDDSGAFRLNLCKFCTR